MIRELGNDPYRGDIHWRLGWYYETHDRFDDAVREYQTALQIRPAEGPYVALAELLEKHGQPEAALTNYLALLELGQNPFTHVKAAGALSALGRSSEAIEHYRAALVLYPNLLPALTNLAWILATDADEKNRNGEEAVRLAEQADGLTGHQSPSALSTLAAAYAEAGRFNEAVATAQTAQALAQAVGDREGAEKIGRLLELYQSGKPFRETPKSGRGETGKSPQ
jgi:tetratricopeptide (TPR) repeat protein